MQHFGGILFGGLLLVSGGTRPKLGILAASVSESPSLLDSDASLLKTVREAGQAQGHHDSSHTYI